MFFANMAFPLNISVSSVMIYSPRHPISLFSFLEVFDCMQDRASLFFLKSIIPFHTINRSLSERRLTQKNSTKEMFENEAHHHPRYPPDCDRSDFADLP